MSLISLGVFAFSCGTFANAACISCNVMWDNRYYKKSEKYDEDTELLKIQVRNIQERNASLRKKYEKQELTNNQLIDNYSKETEEI